MLFQRRRQIKVLIKLFQKFAEREAGLANIAFRRFFGGSQGTFHQGKKGSLRILFLLYKEKISTEICGFASEKLWTTIVPSGQMWITWTTANLIQTYPDGFPNIIFLDFSGRKQVFHKPTAPTTATTD